MGMMTEKSRDSEADRARLDFAEVVKSNFAFLLEKGFTTSAETPSLVTFKADAVELSIYYDYLRSYEISCDIKFRNNRYTLGEIIRSSGPSRAAASRNYAARTAHAVRKGVCELAELVKQYCTEALTGDEQIFAKLDALGKLWARDFAFQIRAKQIRPRAHLEFRQGNFRESADLFEQILPALTPAELRKLGIAKKRS